MADGNILRNQGAGWKLWKRLKDGVNVLEYVSKQRAAYDARPAEFHVYIKSLMDATDMEHRAQLHMMVDLMPTDGDGVYSEFNDNNQYSDAVITLDEAWACCRARQALLRAAVEFQEVAR